MDSQKRLEGQTVLSTLPSVDGLQKDLGLYLVRR